MGLDFWVWFSDHARSRAMAAITAILRHTYPVGILKRVTTGGRTAGRNKGLQAFRASSAPDAALGLAL